MWRCFLSAGSTGVARESFSEDGISGRLGSGVEAGFSGRGVSEVEADFSGDSDGRWGLIFF